MSAFRNGLEGGWEANPPANPDGRGSNRRGGPRPHARPGTGRPSSARASAPRPASAEPGGPRPGGRADDLEIDLDDLPDLPAHPLAPSGERDPRVDDPDALAAGLAMLRGGSVDPEPPARGPEPPSSSSRVSIFGRSVEEEPPERRAPARRGVEDGPMAEAPLARFARPPRGATPPPARAPEPPPSLFGRESAPAPERPSRAPGPRPEPGSRRRGDPEWAEPEWNEPPPRSRGRNEPEWNEAPPRSRGRGEPEWAEPGWNEAPPRSRGRGESPRAPRGRAEPDRAEPTRSRGRPEPDQWSEPGTRDLVEPGTPTVRRGDPRDRGPGPSNVPPGWTGPPPPSTPPGPGGGAAPGAGRRPPREGIPGSPQVLGFGAGAAMLAGTAAPSTRWGAEPRPPVDDRPPPPSVGPDGTIDLRDGTGSRPGPGRIVEPGPNAVVQPAPPALLPPESGAYRLFAVPDTSGPRVLLGLVWLAALLPAVVLGPVAMAVLFGGVAGAAAWGTAQAWQRRGYESDPRLAAGAAVVVSLVAAIHVSLAGVLLICLPVVAVLAASAAPSDRVRKPPVMGTAGAMLRSVVPPCIAVVGVLLVAQSGAWILLVFVALVSAYDAGSYLIGAEASTPLPGIIGGVLCTAVVGVPLMVSQLPPFDGRPLGLVFAALIGVVAPLGQLVASLSLPAAAEWVGPLRRLDAYIVAGPVFAWVVAQFLTATQL